jgi:hypothetical protein
MIFRARQFIRNSSAGKIIQLNGMVTGTIGICFSIEMRKAPSLKAPITGSRSVTMPPSGKITRLLPSSIASLAFTIVV